MGEVALSVAAIIIGHVRDEHDSLRPEGKGKCDAADDRRDDRLCGKRDIGVLKYFSGRGYPGIRHLGLGSFARPRVGDQMLRVYRHGGVAALSFLQ